MLESILYRVTTCIVARNDVEKGKDAQEGVVEMFMSYDEVRYYLTGSMFEKGNCRSTRFYTKTDIHLKARKAVTFKTD